MFIGSMLTGNAGGIITGKWKGTAFRTKQFMGPGVFLLLVAMARLASANRMIS
jgi:hypothetical protein